MIKKPAVIILVLLLFCGCASRSGTNINATYVNGQYVPVYSDVGVSELSPKLFALDSSGRMKYDDKTKEILTGIDVSVFQGDIDWEAVVADGIDYAMLRIGGRGYGPSGLIYEDDNFLKNYNAALSAGLDIGVYFFSQAVNVEEAREEAEFVLNKTRCLELKYPIAFDWENVKEPEARTAGMTKEEISGCAKAFCDIIKNAGRDVIIYFNCMFGYFNYDLSLLKDYNFWLAEYSDAPSFIYNYNMWQYTDSGEVDGISTKVDLNISFADYNINKDS